MCGGNGQITAKMSERTVRDWTVDRNEGGHLYTVNTQLVLSVSDLNCNDSKCFQVGSIYGNGIYPTSQLKQKKATRGIHPQPLGPNPGPTLHRA